MVLTIAFLVLAALSPAVAWMTGRHVRARVQAAQADAEDRQLQEAAARQRQQAVHRPGGLRGWVRRLAGRRRLGVLGMEAERDHQRGVAAKWRDRRTSVFSAIPGDRSEAGVAVAALIVGGIWIAAVANVISLNEGAFEGTGYTLTVSVGIALLLTLGFSLLGLVVWDAVGLTALTPWVEDLERRMRVAVVFSALFLIAAGMTFLPGLVAHRSANITNQVTKLSFELDALRHEGAEPIVIANTKTRLKDARAREATAKTANAFTSVVAPGIEAATSWGAVWLAILLAAWTASSQAARADRRADALELRLAQGEQELENEMLDYVDREGFTEDEVESELGPMTGPPQGEPEAPPPPPDPPRQRQQRPGADENPDEDPPAGPTWRPAF